ncbi:mannitol-1-phosphate 5-dehydrogenase, partial [Planctomycetota bacterium]
MKELLQFGAGKIGRSLCGALFARAGYEVVFVDVDDRVIDALNTHGRYRVIVKDNVPDEFMIERVRAVRATDADAVINEVAKADIVSTAVGAGALEALIAPLAQGVVSRGGRPLDILLCENLRNAADFVRSRLEEKLPPGRAAEFPAGLVETSIGKMVPIMPAEVVEEDPLVVWAEAYNQIIADRQGFTQEPPAVEGLVTRDNFKAYVDRKLFVHNLGHAACAYLGFLEGHELIWQAMESDVLRETALGAMRESGQALLSFYHGEWTAEEMEDHIQDLARRFRNRALGDSVYRVGRDLPRKLAPDDRLIGALRFQVDAGVEPIHTMRAIAAALRFRAGDEKGDLFGADAQFAAFVEERGARAALAEYAGLDTEGADRDLCDRIL